MTEIPLKIFMIAGEASGDALGGKLIAAMKKQTDQPMEFYGIGGLRMANEGLNSLFPMQELSIIGFVEILPRARHLLNRIKETVNEIKRLQPDIVVTIDAPGFSFRVVKELQDSNIKCVHYVAPTVWAYKPKRAEKIAKLYDHLMVLLPFEPSYFEEVGLPCTFVGHPVIEENVSGGDGSAYRKNHNIQDDATAICLLPGSRPGEIKRLLPIYRKTMNIIRKTHKNIHNVIVTTPDRAEYMLDHTKMWPVPLVVSSKNENKADAYAACDIALAKSGTATLELSLAKVPMIITYRVNPVSAWLLRRMIKVQFVNIINLILGKQVIPEFLQERCQPKILAKELIHLMEYDGDCEKQITESLNALEKLGLNQQPSPSEKAATTVLKELAKI